VNAAQKLPSPLSYKGREIYEHSRHKPEVLAKHAQFQKHSITGKGNTAKIYTSEAAARDPIRKNNHMLNFKN